MKLARKICQGFKQQQFRRPAANLTHFSKLWLTQLSSFSSTTWALSAMLILRRKSR